MQFFVTQQRIAKKTGFICHFLLHDKKWRKKRAKSSALGTRLRRRCAQQGDGGNIVYIKLVPWVKYDDPRLLLSKIKRLHITPKELKFSFWLSAPNGFMIFRFYQKAELLQITERKRFFNLRK